MAGPWKELRDARKAAGMLQKELGEKAGMTYSQISQYERGARDPLNMPVKNFLALADALEIDPMALIGDRRKKT